MRRRTTAKLAGMCVWSKTCVTLSGEFCCAGEHLPFTVSWECLYGKSAEDTAGRRMWCVVSHVLVPAWVGVFLAARCGGTNGMAPVLHSTKRPWVLESRGWFQPKPLRHGVWNKAVKMWYLCGISKFFAEVPSYSLWQMQTMLAFLLTFTDDNVTKQTFLC